MDSHFDLTQSPFHLLGLSVRADLEQVVEAQEEALAANRAPEAVLGTAQRTVMTPKTRTEAELSWFPETPPSQASRIVSALEEGSIAEANRALEGLRGLDRANLVADLCSRFSGMTEYVSKLLEAYGDISPESVLETLGALRKVSGFPDPDENQIKDALASIRKKHAKAAVECLASAKNSGKILTDIVEEFIASGWDDVCVRQLLESIVREYDIRSQPQLDRIKNRIESCIAAGKEGNSPIQVNPLVELLEEWDAINQPVQLIEQKKGHEEPRSKEIYKIVRDFCHWAAKENGQFDKSLAISRALLATFPELEAVATQLSKDIEQLEPLAGLRRLEVAKETIESSFSTFTSHVQTSGFGPKSRGLAKKLYDAFSEAAFQTSGTDLADIPWTIIRNMAIKALKLNDEYEFPFAALAVMRGLVHHKKTRPSVAVSERLVNDLRALERHLSRVRAAETAASEAHKSELRWKLGCLGIMVVPSIIMFLAEGC